jgi:hypothetical protein
VLATAPPSCAALRIASLLSSSFVLLLSSSPWRRSQLITACPLSRAGAA